MSEDIKNVRIEVGGSNPGQIVVGQHNVVTQKLGPRPGAVGEAEWEDLRRALTELAAQVAQQVPPPIQAEAANEVADLTEASTREEPDVGAMSKVWSWFLDYAPTLIGGVATVVFHPVVGALVQASGDALVTEFQRNFGRPPGSDN
jgi:hypothetical protein